MKIKIILFAFLLGAFFSNAQVTLKLFPTINSVGIQVSFPSSFDADSNAYCFVKYNKSGSTQIDGFKASRINNYGKYEFRGSLFMLEANTKYIVNITVVDSVPSLQTFLLTDSVTTNAEPVISATSNIKYVSPAGSGTAYTLASPGDLKTLLGAGLSCGTTVILKGGTYSTGDMQLNLTQDCSSASPIIIMAAPGETPVIDGGDYTQYVWTKSNSDPDLYSTTFNAGLEFNSLCLMDSTRLYPYGLLTPSNIDPQYPCLSNLNYELSGFYRKDRAVYIKTIDHKDPNNSTIVFSKYFSCLRVLGNRHKNYLYVKGITFKNYGKGSCYKDAFGIPTCYPSYSVSFDKANNVIVDSCRFEYCNLPLGFDHSSNNKLIQNSIFIDGIGRWSHGAFKQTRDENVSDIGMYGRYLEYSAINLFPDDTIQKGTIIRNNYVKGSIGGLVGERVTSYEGIEETDIYNNRVTYCYNAINADGGSLNTRIWNNEIDHVSVGFSFISAAVGPNYIFKNNVQIIERKNHRNDIFFNDCNNVLSNKIWGTGVKLNATSITSNPPEMLFVNNTFHTQDSIAFCMYLWGRTWKKLSSFNNIFYSEGLSSLFFDGPKGDSLYFFRSNYDCYYNKGNSIAATIQAVNGQLPCISDSTGKAMGNDLKAVTKCVNAVVLNDFNTYPDFVNVVSDQHLNTSSPLVDKGIIVNGINQHFNGMAPDIGAFETDAIIVVPIITANSSLTFCQGDSVVLSCNSATSYLWSTTATTQSITVKTDGTYSVSVDGGNSFSQPIVVTVNTLPPIPTISESGGTLTSSATNGNQWFFNGGQLSNANQQNYTATQDGDYTVKVTNNNSCSIVSAVFSFSATVNTPIPIITSNGSLTICQGDSVTLSSSVATTYLWSTGATTQTIIVKIGGSYTVSVDGSNSASQPIVVTVNALPPIPTISESGGVLTSNTPSGNQWFFNGGQLSNANQQNYTATQDGDYTVKVTNSFSCSNISAAFSYTTTINTPIPIITSNGLLTICQGDSVTLTSSTANAYLWSTGATTQSILVKTGGTYTVSVDGGSTVSAPTTVIVNALPPTPTITESGGGGAIGSPPTVLTSSSATGNQWYMSGNSISNANQQTYNPSPTGDYSVKVTDSNMCTAVSSIYSYTATITAPPVSKPIITSNGSLTICQGDSVMLTSSNASSYLWSTNATTQSIIIKNAGTYSVSVNGGAAVSDPSIVVVNNLPTITSIPNPSSAAVCLGNSITLSGAGNASPYQWAGPIVIQDSQPFTPTILGNSTFTVSGTDANGCKNSALRVITVLALPTVGIVVTPPVESVCLGNKVTLKGTGATTYTWSGGIADGVAFTPIILGATTYTVTGSENSCVNTATQSIIANICSGAEVGIHTDNERLPGLLIYPNPNSGIFKIETSGGSISAIKIYDLLGEIIYESSNQVTEINLSESSKGTYFVEVYSAGQFYHKKLIIQ